MEKAFLHTERREKISCQFNPADLTITKANSWTGPDRVGCNAPSLTFQAGKSGTMTLSLTLDTTHDGTSVTVPVNKLLDLMKVDKKLKGAAPKQNKARPPWVEFRWGDLHTFKAVVERMQVKFTYFASSGMPLRAKVDLSLTQFKDDEEVKNLLQNPTSYTPTPHTMHRVVHGETLDRIAASHYADATRWRLIAEANAVVDPLAVPAGTMLVIPEIPVRRRG
jgi:hypothetical protein